MFNRKILEKQLCADLQFMSDHASVVTKTKDPFRLLQMFLGTLYSSAHMQEHQAG